MVDLIVDNDEAVSKCSTRAMQGAIERLFYILQAATTKYTPLAVSYTCSQVPVW